MSENSEFEARKQPGTEPAPAVEGDSGQYVDGDYGKAGIAREDETMRRRRRISRGRFRGGRGRRGNGTHRRRRVRGGDYGKAGTAGENLVTVEEAEYPDGDYGSAGTAGAGSGGPRVRPIGAEEVPEEHRLVEDEVPVEDDADEEDEDLPRDPA